jgi:hypothetical protein
MMDHDLHQKNIGYHWIFFHPLRLNHKPTKNPSSQINGSWNAVDDTKKWCFNLMKSHHDNCILVKTPYQWWLNLQNPIQLALNPIQLL